MFQVPFWVKVSGLAIALAVAVVYLSNRMLSSAYEAALVEHEVYDLKDDTAVLAHQLIHQFDRLRAETYVLAGDPSLSGGGLAAALQRLNEREIRAGLAPRFLGAALIDRDGRVIASAGERPDGRMTAAARGANLPQNGPGIISHFEPGMTAVIAAARARNSDNILTLSLDFGVLHAIVTKPPRVHPFLTDPEGVVLVGPAEQGGDYSPGSRFRDLFPEVDDEPGLAFRADLDASFGEIDLATGDLRTDSDKWTAGPLSRTLRIPPSVREAGADRLREVRVISKYLTEEEISKDNLKAWSVFMEEMRGQGRARYHPIGDDEINLPNRLIVSVGSEPDTQEVMRFMTAAGLEGVDTTTQIPTHLHYIRVTPDPVTRPTEALNLVVLASEAEFKADSKHAITKARRRMFSLAGCLAAFASVAMALVITGPLRTFRRAAGKIGEGDYDSVRLPKSSTREVVSLARSLDTMIGRVRHREARLSAVLDNAAEGVVITDARGRIESFNRAAERIFRVRNRHARGRNFREFLDDDVTPTLPGEASDESGTTDAGLKVRAPRHVERHGRRGDGTAVPVEVAAEIAVVSGEEIHVYLIRDITERKQAEAENRRLNDELRRERDTLDERVRDRTRKLEQASVARDLFLASVNHELRQPLTAVIGYCDMLAKKKKDDPAVLQLVTKIRTHGSHQLSIINDILDYQRIIMGRVDLELSEFPLKPVLEAAAETAGDKAAAQGNRIVVDCPEDLMTIRADRRRVRQMIDNLLSNACKFTRDGTITLRVWPGWETVRIDVSDTGRGIPADKLDEIFRPLNKILDRKDNPEGTGLGLAICQQLSQLMGGDITCQSVEGQGTTFTVEIPVDVRPPDPGMSGILTKSALTRAMVSDSDPNLPPPEPIRNRRVLVIDDDAAVCEIMSRMLEEEGFEIVSAAGGEEGIRLARELRPCVITLDVIMPGMDGWATLAKLKADPVTSDIPVVMMTMLESGRKGFTLGAAEFVHKPVEDWDRLTKILNGCCQCGAEALLIEEDAEFSARLSKTLRERAGVTVRVCATPEAARAALADRVPSLVLINVLMPGLGGVEFVQEVQRDRRFTGVPVVVLTSRELSDSEREHLNRHVEQVVRTNGPADELVGRIRRAVGSAATGGNADGEHVDR